MFGQGKSIYCDVLKPEPCIATLRYGDTPCNDWQFSVFSLAPPDVGFELFDRGALPEWQFWRPNDRPALIRFVHYVEKPREEKPLLPTLRQFKSLPRVHRLVKRCRKVCAVTSDRNAVTRIKSSIDLSTFVE